MNLADLIDQRRSEILERWVARTYRSIAPASLDREDVLNELNEVLKELVGAMRRDLAEGVNPDPEPLDLAQHHGRQRFSIGYDIASLVREHLILRQVIFDIIREAGYRPDLAEIDSLSNFLLAALAETTSTYAIARDQEVRDQAERYVGFLAHELRNPLGTARTATSILRERGQLPATRAADSLDRSLGRMQELLDGALSDFAARGAPQPSCSSFELGEFLAEVAAESAPEAEAKEIATSIEVPGAIEVVADRRLLRSAVSNLVRNAIKFSRRGTAVKLEAKRGQGRVTIAVTDGCGGLPAGSVERIFNPFVQAGTDRTGFGLGLAIAKQAADAHGGSIRVHDIPASGCVFVLDLPDLTTR